MTDAELAAITEALHKSRRELYQGWPTASPQATAIDQLGLAVELLTDIVYRMGKR